MTKINEDNRVGGAEVIEIKLQSFLEGPYGGISIDLKDIYSEINIYEDLFSNTISASITLVDTLNLLNKIPIVGHEAVKIRYKTSLDFSDMNEDGIKEITFRVSGVSGRVLSPNRKAQIYTIEMVSQPFMSDMTRKVNRSYSGNIGEIIINIFDTYIKPYDLNFGKFFKEPELLFDVGIANDYQCIVPGLTPFQSINWLLSRAVSEHNAEDVSFLLYQDSNTQEYKVSSLNTLMSQDTVSQVYYYGNVFSGGDTKYGERNRSNVFNIVKNFNIGETFNLLDTVDIGLFSGAVLSHDLIKKEVEINLYDYNSFVFSDRTQAEGKNPVIPESNEFVGSPSSKIEFYSKRDSISDVGVDQDIEKYPSRIFQRRSLFNQMDLFKISFTCYGDSRRKVGEKVTFIAPPFGSVDPETDSVIDKNLSGEYLVTALHHKITLDEYDMVVELSKNSLGTPIPVETKLEVE